jgi:DNA-binding NtrC family response regulator
VDYFTRKITEEQGLLPKIFSEEALELLKNYQWTGNIRELRNVVERLLILGGDTITEEDVLLFASK